MTKKRDAHPWPKPQDEKALSRRNFLKQGAVAGVGVAAFGGGVGPAMAQGADGISWDYEADVVVIGAGASGLPVAIRARDAGMTVIVIDQNFDVGGKMLHSGAQVSLGGGDPVQLRDIAGEADKEGFITVPPIQKPAEMTETPDFLFRDMTDWSVLDVAAQAPYRYNERDLQRSWADNCYGTRQFLIDNYVRFGRIQGTHPGGGISRARRAVAFLKLGDKTDIKAGTVTREDAGIPGKSSSAFAPRIMGDGSQVAAPNTVTNGAALARPLEFSAREKGAQFMLNRRMTDIIREQPFAGRVIGVRAVYSPRFDPDTGKQLTSYWSNGNIDEKRDTIHVRARYAVMVGTGGFSQNPNVRGMFYPAWRDPAYGSCSMALLGPHGQQAAGMLASMKIGAALAGMQQNLTAYLTGHIPNRIATFDSYTDMYPGHPTFSYRGSTGIGLGTSSYEQLIAVNQVGKRFFNEMNLGNASYSTPVWPGGASAGSPTKLDGPCPGRLAQRRSGLGSADVRPSAGCRRGDRHQRRIDGSRLLYRAALGDLRCRHHRPRRLGYLLSPHQRHERHVLHRRHYRRPDEQADAVSLPAGARQAPEGHGRYMELLCRQGRRSRFRAR